MVISIGVLPKKRGRRATGKDPMLNFCALWPLAVALDARLAARPRRFETIGRLLAKALSPPA